MIDRDALLERMREVSARLDPYEKDDVRGEARDLLEDAMDALDQARSAIWYDKINGAEADAGETAKPPLIAPDEFSAPQPVADGRFLVIMHDRNANGWLWMRRYAKKEDAMCIVANYNGAEQVWVYEVGRELDLEAELNEFWRVIGKEAALEELPV